MAKNTTARGQNTTAVPRAFLGAYYSRLQLTTAILCTAVVCKWFITLLLHAFYTVTTILFI